jgi:hypothetical protein
MQRTSLITDPGQLAGVLAGKSDETGLAGIRLAPNASQIVSEWIPLPYGYQVFTVMALLSSVFILTGWVDGVLTTSPFGDWRSLFLGPVTLAYLLLLEPALRILRDRAASSLVVKIPNYESDLSGILGKVPGCSRTGQLAGFAVGFTASFLIFFEPWAGVEIHLFTFTGFYWGIATSIMFGYLSWLVYTWIVAIKMFGQLQTAATDYGPLKCEDMYPVGRWAIAIGTSIILFSAISMMFLSREALLSYQSAVIFPVLFLTAFGITFAASWSTHRMMERVKKSALRQALDRISGLAVVITRAPSQIDAEQLRAWIALEARLESTSSWPFDTAMLRRMFLAISIPGAAAGARILPNLLSK